LKDASEGLGRQTAALLDKQERTGEQKPVSCAENTAPNRLLVPDWSSPERSLKAVPSNADHIQGDFHTLSLNGTRIIQNANNMLALTPVNSDI